MQEVQIKAPKHEFTLLCDDIRQEMGGKTSLMGLYDHHIVVPQVPFMTVLWRLCRLVAVWLTPTGADSAGPPHCLPRGWILRPSATRRFE